MQTTSLDLLRQPHPEQSQIDAECARLLRVTAPSSQPSAGRRSFLSRRYGLAETLSNLAARPDSRTVS
jgi:hypothetical protein